MIINLSIRELENLLEMTPPEHNIMLSGKHGIGKSQIITSFFKKKGIRVQPLFLGQMSDSGDLIGLPRIVEKQTEHEIKDTQGNIKKVPTTVYQTVFALPYWFPQDGKPIVLFLDELNRARPELLQTIMDLALNRTLAGHSLPPGSRIISAINVGEEYQLTELDPALVDRFNVYNLSPTPGEWLMYAKEKGFDSRVIDFIADNNGMLLGIRHEAASDLDKSPSPRAWERVSDLIKNTANLTTADKKAIAGIVGPEAATAFMAFQQQIARITGEDVIRKYPEVKDKIKNFRMHEMSVLNEDIFRALSLLREVDSYAEENIYRYVNDLFTDDSRKEMRSDFVALLRKKDLYKVGIQRMLKIRKVYPIIQSYYASINV